MPICVITSDLGAWILDRSRIGLLIKLASLFFNGPVGGNKTRPINGPIQFFFWPVHLFNEPNFWTGCSAGPITCRQTGNKNCSIQFKKFYLIFDLTLKRTLYEMLCCTGFFYKKPVYKKMYSLELGKIRNYYYSKKLKNLYFIFVSKTKEAKAKKNKTQKLNFLYKKPYIIWKKPTPPPSTKEKLFLIIFFFFSFFILSYIFSTVFKQYSFEF